MTIAPPSNIGYGTVVWDALSGVKDGPDADHVPDFVAPSGTVSFVLSAAVLRDAAASPRPVTVLSEVTPGVMGPDGQLYTPKVDGTPDYVGVQLIANDDPDLNPTGTTYTVVYNLVGSNGSILDIPSHPIVVLEGQTVDLTLVGPVEDAQQVGIPQAEALAAQAATSAVAAAEAAEAAQADAAAALAGLGTKVEKPAGPTQFVIYGASQSVDPGLRCTPGLEWFKQVASALGTIATTYAYSGRRTSDMASYALSGTAPTTGQGPHPAGAAATWPGMDTAGKISILDVSMNDIGHYPAMNVSPAVPAPITGAAGARYVAGMGGALRCLLATMCSQSRVESVAATSTGVWASAPIGSAGATAYSSAVGATRTYTVTPPQGGEFAGEVYHVGVTLSAESGAVSAPFTYSVDGGAESAVQTPPGWERYKGWGGANIDSTNFVTKISVPVDGLPHTIRITHAGAAGNVLYSDCVLIPSAKPLPILVLAAPREVKVAPGIFDATGVAVYGRNWRIIEDQQKAIVAEFPNAIYIPSGMTPNGLSNVDGLHGNDRGEEQRANDVLSTVNTNPRLRSMLLSIRSSRAPDSDYATL